MRGAFKEQMSARCVQNEISARCVPRAEKYSVRSNSRYVYGALREQMVVLCSHPRHTWRGVIKNSSSMYL